MPKKTSQPRRSTLVNAEDDSVLTKRKGVPLKEKEGPTTRPNLNTLPLSSDQDRVRKKVKGAINFPRTLPLVDDEQEETKGGTGLDFTTADVDLDEAPKEKKKRRKKRPEFSEEQIAEAMAADRRRTRASNDELIGQLGEPGGGGGSHKINRKNYEKQILFPPSTHDMLSDWGRELYEHRKRPNMGDALTEHMLTSPTISKTQAGDMMRARYDPDEPIPKMTFTNEDTKQPVAISRNHKIADSQITTMLYDMATNQATAPHFTGEFTPEHTEGLQDWFKKFGIEQHQKHIDDIKHAVKILRDDSAPKDKRNRDAAQMLNGVSSVLSLSGHNLRFGYSVPNTLIGNSADQHMESGIMTPISDGLTSSTLNLGNIGLVKAKLTQAATQTAIDRETGKPITSDIDHRYSTDQQMGLVTKPKGGKKKQTDDPNEPPKPRKDR